MPDPIHYLRPLFFEQQRFRQRWLWIVIALTSVFLSAVAIALIVTLNAQPAVVAALVMSIPIGLMIAFYLAANLTVRVDVDGVHIRFFPIHKLTLPHARIVAVEPRDYDPLGEFGGWGMKGPPARWGWCYTVSGRRGVRIELDNRHRLLIGSQRADELAAAIRECRSSDRAPRE
jgi:hypothetical protein